MPNGIRNIVFKNESKGVDKVEFRCLTLEEDRAFIKNLNLNVPKTPKGGKIETVNKVLHLADIYWLYDYIQAKNAEAKDKVYLHELFEGSKVELPKNQEIMRNPILEKRCQQLKEEQDRRNYNKMTKNVDNARKSHPEDTIAYQLKQINKHLIAIFQFIVSVLAGFAFGFIGLELLLGSLDFGFRLLMGIICSLIIALAELYFLAKKLNEDLYFEEISEKKLRPKPSTKLD